jgi:hypothetical protein
MVVFAVNRGVLQWPDGEADWTLALAVTYGFAAEGELRFDPLAARTKSDGNP